MSYNFPLDNECKITILLLVIFLFGLLILSSNKSCGCKKKVFYRRNKYNQHVITNEKEIPDWVVKLKNKE
jgi:hypothetical protein